MRLLASTHVSATSKICLSLWPCAQFRQELQFPLQPQFKTQQDEYTLFKQRITDFANLDKEIPVAEVFNDIGIDLKDEESIKKLEKKISEIKNNLFKATGENNFVKQASDYQNTLKSDNARQLKNMEAMLHDCVEENKRLREELTAKKIQKD